MKEFILSQLAESWLHVLVFIIVCHNSGRKEQRAEPTSNLAGSAKLIAFKFTYLAKRVHPVPVFSHNAADSILEALQEEQH